MDDSKPESPKQLKELLQHQQEPFSLHNYLSEKSYMFKNFSSDSSNIHRPIKCDLHNIGKRLLQAKGILRSLLYKFIPAGDTQEFSIWDGEHQYVHRITIGTKTKPKNGFSSAKRLASSDHVTYNDVEGKFLSYEHRKPILMNMFQTFTVPRLRRQEVDTVSRPHWISRRRNEQKYSTESGWKEPFPNASVGDPMFSTYLRKQLLFYSVEKGKEFYENEGKNLSIKTVSELEDLQYIIIHEHFCLLEKQYGEVIKTIHLLHTESFITSEEWRNPHKLNGKIHMEIADAIVDDIVKEIIDFFLD